MGASPHGEAALVVVDCPHEVAEVVADRLWVLGASAIEERLVGPLVELRACFGDDRETVSAHVESGLSGLDCAWRYESVDLAVTETWREYVGVTHVGEWCVLRPAWVEPDGSVRPVEIVLEPGPTFGLGNHPTTRASLEILRSVVRPGDRVLDVGTGSGVLAVGSVLLGAAHAHGIDITPASLSVVAQNAIRNGVGERVTVGIEDLSEVADEFDIVVANILAPALVDLAPELVRRAAHRLVLSGLMADRYEHVVDAMTPLGVLDTVEIDGWVALSLGR